MSAAQVFVDAKAFRVAGRAQRKKLREQAAKLEHEPFMGDRIRRSQIPRRFRTLPNLYRLELPGGWRALYTVASRPAEGTQVRIVWIGDHKGYDRLFGYG